MSRRLHEFSRGRIRGSQERFRRLPRRPRDVSQGVQGMFQRIAACHGVLGVPRDLIDVLRESQEVYETFKGIAGSS